MYVPFHLLKKLHQEPFFILYFFFTLPPRGKQGWQPRSARAYMRAEVSFDKFLFLPSWFAKLLEANFFVFFQNYMDAKLVCQTVGVAPSSYILLE
jgi:hypothetical protein